ncbi:AraC family transcriptional regulator [Caenimonas sedimenti]|uniref:AraC family transcriptional regulator n=1 Tax=Caenimonas sedimenti TaxID=2596921 RepID=A0A562ZLJ4_9BURK|nr:AraC family transcriptional regulator [Caenimonas sedimenti]TWO69440.1 AraC family transcriptional regulator [Caenimonas sedimenti]
MTPAPLHRSQVWGSPWPGIHAAQIWSGRHYGRHAHDFYGVGVLEQGAQRSSSGRLTVDAHAGDVLAHNPGEVHDGRPLHCEARAWRMVYFEPEAMAALAAETNGGAAEMALALPVMSDAPLQQAWRRLLGDLARWQAGACDALPCDESLVLAAHQLLGRHAAPPRAPASAAANLERARQRLGDDLAHAPALSELAQIAGLSRYQLLRRFAAAYGVTPHAWLLQRRAERARALIANGSSVTQAAGATGFADQSHMTRIFTRHFGFTPGAWQRARRPQ